MKVSTKKHRATIFKCILSTRKTFGEVVPKILLNVPLCKCPRVAWLTVSPSTSYPSYMPSAIYPAGPSALHTAHKYDTAQVQV